MLQVNKNRFNEYKCRICRKTSCCVTCRLKHEKTVHNIHPDCNICIYGRMYLRNPSECLLSHMKETHWPLHCIKCKKIFQDTNELTIHKKCSLESEVDQNPITPIRMGVTETTHETYESPPVMDTLSKYTSNSNIVFKYSKNTTVTTSTPTQNEGNNFIENVSFVSPIDSMMKPANDIKEIIYNKTKEESENNLAVLPVENSTELESVKNKDTPINTVLKTQSMKRKVTFSTESNSTRQITNTKSFNSESGSYNKQENSNVLEYLSGEPNGMLNSETENTHNTTIITSVEINNTFWTTASELNPLLKFKENCEVTSTITVNENCEITSSTINEERKDIVKVNKSTGIWSSMANLVKTFVQGLSGSTSSLNECKSKEIETCQRSLKRMRTYSDDALDDIRIYKKIKLTDIKARKPIHTLKTPYRVLKKKVRMCDKSTQTD